MISVLEKVIYLEPSPQCNDWDPSAWSARQAKQLLVYLDLITGDRSFVTDLQRAKYRRERVLFNFLNTYWASYEMEEVGLVSAVIDADEYKNVSLVIRGLKKRLKSRKAELLGYVCCRDKGDLCHRNHFHLLFAADNLNLELVETLYDSEHSSAEPLLTEYGMIYYLKKKDLISPFRKNAFTRSRIFKRSRLSKTNDCVDLQDYVIDNAQHPPSIGLCQTIQTLV